MCKRLALVCACLLLGAPGAHAMDAPPFDLETLGFQPFDGHRTTSTSMAADAVPFDLIRSDYVDMIYMNTADLNGDGWPDLIFSGWLEHTYIAWGSGDGSFGTPTLLDSSPMTGFATGYFDSDNDLDIVTLSSSSLKIWLNDGDSTFTSSTIGSVSSNLRAIVTGYFNNDAYLDLVVTPGQLYFGNGSGGFTSGGSLMSTGVDGFAVADFDLDGYDDIAAVGTQWVWLLLNNGSGSFTRSDSLYTGQGGLSVSTANAMADFNRDGNPDFATITPLIGIDRCTSNNFWRSVVSVCFGDGNGHIASVDTFSVCGTSYNMVVTDVDRDGELDFAVGNGSTKELEVFLGDGAGDFTWSFARSFETDSITFVLATADLDVDGNVDFVAGGGILWGDSIVALVNSSPDPQLSGKSMEVTGYGAELGLVTPGSFEISRLIVTEAGGSHVRRDFNTDGTLDEAAIDPTTIYGDYDVVIEAMPNAAPGATFDADLTLSDGTHAVLFKNYPSPATPITFTYPFESTSAVSPASGLRTNSAQPVLSWGGLIPAGVTPDMYEIQVDATHDFSSPTLLVDATGLSSPSYAMISPLTPDNVYYWRVRWFANGGWSDYSTAFAAYVTEMMCGDVDGSGQIDVRDLTFLVDFLFRAGLTPPNPNAADMAGQDGINIGDLTYLVQYLFQGDFPPTECPQ